MIMTLTLLLRGSPLGRSDCFEVQTWTGDTWYMSRHASVQGTKFFPGRADLPDGVPPAAVRSFILPISEEALVAFPNIVFDGPAKKRTDEQDAFEELMAKSAKAGIEMFIEWLRTHPDQAVREQFVRTITKDDPIASLL